MANDSKDFVSKFVERKRSQALRSNEPELRAFEQKLKDSFVFKQQMCQVKEKEYEKLRKEIDRKREFELEYRDKLHQEEIENRKKADNIKTKVQYANDLQSQINLQQVLKITQKQKKIEEDMKNKELMKTSENLDLKTKAERITEMRHEMELFQKYKQVQEIRNELLLSSESQAIKEYINNKERRDNEIVEKQKEKCRIKDEIYEKIASKMILQQKLQEERYLLIKELQEREYKQKHLDVNNKISESNNKLEIMKALKHQIESNKLKEKEIKKEEALYRNQLFQQLEQHDKIEYERKILDKLKSLKYAADINNQIESDKKQKKKEQERISKTDKLIQQYNEEILAKIAMEKLKLIKEYSYPN